VIFGFSHKGRIHRDSPTVPARVTGQVPRGGLQIVDYRVYRDALKDEPTREPISRLLFQQRVQRFHYERCQQLKVRALVTDRETLQRDRC
jgi:hypothetical protein